MLYGVKAKLRTSTVACVDTRVMYENIFFHSHHFPLRPSSRVPQRPWPGSNPFVVCGMASKSIYEATIKRQMHYAPLGRLQQRIMELTLEVSRHGRGVMVAPVVFPAHFLWHVIFFISTA